PPRRPRHRRPVAAVPVLGARRLPRHPAEPDQHVLQAGLRRQRRRGGRDAGGDARRRPARARDRRAGRSARPPVGADAGRGGALTATGARCPTLAWLGVSQTLARSFSTALTLVISIIAVEEMPAGSRAFAVSVLTATAALGAGMAVMLLKVADLGLNAWRVL